MRKRLRFLGVFLLLLFLVIILASGFMMSNGRRILALEAEKQLGEKVYMSTVTVAFPLTFVIEDLAIGEDIYVKKVVVVPSLLGCLKGHIVLNSLLLEKPKVKITRLEGNVFDYGLSLGKLKEEDDALSRTQEDQKDQGLTKTDKKKTQKFFLNRLKVKDATIRFVDETISEKEPFEIRLSRLNADFYRASFLQLLHMHFKASGRLSTRKDVMFGFVETAGWFDILTKDMDAKLEVREVDLAHLGAYPKKFLKRELKSGEGLLTSQIVSKKNDLNADCHLELDRLAFKDIGDAVGEGKVGFGDFAFLAFDVINPLQEKMILDFSIRTKMDNPKFENVTIRGAFVNSAVENALGGIIKKPGETVEKFEKIGQRFKDIGKQFKNIFGD